MRICIQLQTDHIIQITTHDWLYKEIYATAVLSFTGQIVDSFLFPSKHKENGRQES